MRRIRHINIEVTRACNQKCVYCFNNSGIDNQNLQVSLAKWVEILSSLKRYGVRSILLTGGEPFIWRDTIDLLECAQEMDLETSVLSNGYHVPTLVRDHSYIFQKLIVAQISLDSMDPVTNDARRGYNGAWQQAVKAIEAFRSLYVPVEISCVVTDDNIGELMAIGDYSKSVGASMLIRPMAKVGRASMLDVSLSFFKRLEAVQSQLQKTGVDVVSDRFLYAPVDDDVDSKALQEGIFTVESNGTFRIGGLCLCDGSAVNNVRDLTKVA